MLYKELTLPLKKRLENTPQIVFDLLFYLMILFTFLGCINFFMQQGLMITISLVFALTYIFLKQKIVINMTTILTICFAIFYSLSSLIYYSDLLFMTILYSFALPIFVQLFNCFDNKRKLLIYLGGAYVIGLFCSFILIVIRTYWMQGLPFDGDVVNNFWNSSIISRTGVSLYVMAFIGIMFALLFFNNRFRQWYTIPAIIFIIAFCTAVSFMIGNRSYIVAIAILVYAILFFKVLETRRHWIAWIVIMAVYSVVVIGSLLLVKLANAGKIVIPEALMKINVINRIFSVNINEGRPQILHTFFTEFYKYPIGGFSQFIHNGYVHNLLLDFYSFGGIIPFGLATTFFVFLFIYLFKFCNLENRSTFEKGIIVSVIFAIIGIGVIEPIYQANPNSVTVLFLVFLYMKECSVNGNIVIESQTDASAVPNSKSREVVIEMKNFKSIRNNEVAIIIIAYDKPGQLKKSFENLLKVDYENKDVDLIISIDNSGTNDVETVAKELNWPFGAKIVRTFSERQGLKNHILKCFEYAETYNVIFLLEDDIYASKAMFNYGYNAAKFYDKYDEIAGISLYNFQGNWQNWALRFEPLRTGYDSYFIRLAQSWGEVVTTKQWLKFKRWLNENPDFVKDKKNVPSINRWPDSSWLKFFDRYCFLNNKFFVYPYLSVVTNCNGVGVHNNKSCNDFQVEMPGNHLNYKFEPFEFGNPNTVAYDEYFNPMWLEKFLGLAEEEITVDFWCTKPTYLYKKYVLTAGYYGKKYEKSFSLSLHPIELSIRENLEGEGLYLYKSEDIIKKTPNLYNLYNYSSRTSDWRRVKFYNFKLFFKTYFGLIRKKLSKKFKRASKE